MKWAVIAALLPTAAGAYIMFCCFSYFRADLRKQAGNFRKLFYCVVRLYVVVVYYSFGIEPDGCYPGVYAAFLYQNSGCLRL